MVRRTRNNSKTGCKITGKFILHSINEHKDFQNALAFLKIFFPQDKRHDDLISGKFTELISESLHYTVMLFGIFEARIHLTFSHWLFHDLMK